MKTTNEAETLISTVTEPEYEWGVKLRSCWSGDSEIKWGYSEDPRLSGVIDAEGDIEINSYYHEVIAVGKRLKAPEIWENI